LPQTLEDSLRLCGSDSFLPFDARTLPETRMTTIRSAVAVSALSLAMVLPAHAQQGTDAPLRFIVPAPAGSAPDIGARVLGEEMRQRLNRTVLIENRPGAGGIISVMATRAAPPDGNTLLFTQAAVVTITPLTYRAAKYDAETDLAPIAIVADSPMLIVAHATNGPKSLADAIAQAKSKPDSLVIGSPARGSVPNLAAELLAGMTGAAFRIIPMSTSVQAVQAIGAGDTHMSVDGAPPLMPMVRAGRTRALALTADRTLPGFEGVPLAKDTVPGLVVSGWFMLFAPAGTPAAVIERLNRVVDASVKAPAVVQKYEPVALYPVGGTVAEARAFLASEKKLWARAVERAGLKPE